MNNLSTRWLRKVIFSPLVILTLLCSGVSTLRAQTADQYLALIQEMTSRPDTYPFSVIKKETERFLRSYPLHESGSDVALTMALATLGIGDQSPITGLVEMARTAQLFGVAKDTVLWITTVNRLVREAEQGPLFSGLERVQTETLQQLALKRLCDGPKFRRAFQFLDRLYQVRSKRLADILTEQCEWFLRVFPGSPCADTVRFWMGNIAAERGRHAVAASRFLALARLYPSSRLGPEAVLAAADELCERPVWRFAEAADLLQRYLDSFDDGFRRSALQRLVFLMEDKLHDRDRAEEYLLELASRFGDDFEIPEKIFRRVLERLGRRVAEPALSSAAARYLDLYPEGKLAETARQWLRRTEE